MKKFLYIGVFGIFTLILSSCNSTSKQTQDTHSHTHTADQHDHTNCTHNHDAEHDHNHDAEHEHDHANCTHNHDTAPAHDHDHQHSHGDAHNHGDAHSHGDAASSDEIVLSKEKAEAAGVKASIIQPTTFNHVIKTSGQVLAAQGNEAVASATAAGIVSFRNQLVEGMNVSKGTPLLSVSATNLADGDPIQRARISYETARKEYERMKPLVESKIVSEKDFIQATQNYENARVSYEAIAKNYSSGGQGITSPMNGYVKSILVKEGDYVELGQPLVSITQNRRLFLRAEVSEKYYSQLRKVSSANFKTPYDNQTYLLNDLNGKLLSYGKSAGDNSFYVPVTFEFDNRGDILPGSFVEIYLLCAPMENVIALPHTALTEEQGNYFVYMKLDDECYTKQPVTLGADNGSHVQILSGVHQGDNIVTEGAYQVKLASAGNALPAHTHEH